MKKILLLVLTIFLCVMVFPPPSFSASHSIPPDKATKTKVLASYAKLPLAFIENRGQVNKEVAYYLKGRQGTIYFTHKGIVYDLISASPAPSKKQPLPPERKRLSFTITPIGASKDHTLIATERLPGKIHYLIGNDPTKWKTQIPIYKEIIYKDLYTGIDLKIYGTTNQMEYDFIVSPGAEPSHIHLACDGIKTLTINNKGDLIIDTALAQLTHLKPIIYQVIDGKRYMREGSFKVTGTTVSFAIGDYDTTYPLIIDPLTLSYSSFLGGSDDDWAFGIAVDTSGNAYVAGGTESLDFPTQTPYQGLYGGGYDAFVTKITSNGTTLSYSTYLGGSGWDWANGIAVDTSGNAYVAGYTYSSNFPTQNPYQGAHGGGDEDAFITKLSPGGDTLSYSTYLGGSGDDWAYAIAVDKSGNAYVAGDTGSANFPTKNPYQGTFRGGYLDAFVTKFNPGGNTLSYSTYLGGSDIDYASGIAVDTSGNAYVAGFTCSLNFPTQNPYQATHRGGATDAFVAKITDSTDPLPDIKANGSDGPLTVSPSTPVSITVSLDPGNEAGTMADWWVYATTPFGTYSYVYPSGWYPGIIRAIATPLFSLSSTEILNRTLPVGSYDITFAVDNNADNILDGTWEDSVELTVK